MQDILSQIDPLSEVQAFMMLANNRKKLKEKLTLGAHLLLPPLEALPNTELSLELGWEFCSFVFPVSTICFMDIPPQGSPERL
jgi:hypothetical protein